MTTTAQQIIRIIGNTGPKKYKEVTTRVNADSSMTVKQSLGYLVEQEVLAFDEDDNEYAMIEGTL